MAALQVSQVVQQLPILSVIAPRYFRSAIIKRVEAGRSEDGPGLAEIQFVLTDPGVSADEIKAILGEKGWFSSHEEWEPLPPVDRFGIIWDEHVSLIYLRRDEDIMSLVGYTVWSLFRERFDHFPNVIPDERFCRGMLEYLKGIKGEVLIEWDDFSQKGDEYRLSIHRHVYGVGVPAKELPDGDKAQISFSDIGFQLHVPPDTQG